MKGVLLTQLKLNIIFFGLREKIRANKDALKELESVHNKYMKKQEVQQHL